MSPFDQVVKAFGAGRARTVGGLAGVDGKLLESLVEDAEEELTKRMSKEKWTQKDLDRLACAFVVLAYKTELGDDSDADEEDDEEDEDD